MRNEYNMMYYCIGSESDVISIIVSLFIFLKKTPDKSQNPG